jgi:hypothetical protein
VTPLLRQTHGGNEPVKVAPTIAVMTTRLKGRRRSVERLIRDMTVWAHSNDKVGALVLVGSYAQGAERMASDVDLVVLSEDPASLANTSWFQRVRPGARLIRTETWGPVQKRRFRLKDGLIVELGIAPSSWATVPLDASTRRVLSDGHRVLYDTGLMTGASANTAQQKKTAPSAVPTYKNGKVL